MSSEAKVVEPGVQAPQCQFFVQRKKRLCRMTVKPGRQYCGEHEPQPKGGAGEVDRRIPCPNDPKHTCYASKLEKHLKICNARRTAQPAYIVDNINTPEPVEECSRKPLSTVPKDVVLKLIDKINHLYSKYLDGQIKSEPQRPVHHAVLPEFSEADRTESSLRHLRQTSALLWIAEREGLVRDGTCYVELGAGKGQLSYYACHAWCGGGAGRVLAVDRAPLRHKRDNKLRSAPPHAKRATLTDSLHTTHDIKHQMPMDRANVEDSQSNIDVTDRASAIEELDMKDQTPTDGANVEDSQSNIDVTDRASAIEELDMKDQTPTDGANVEDSQSKIDVADRTIPEELHMEDREMTINGVTQNDVKNNESNMDTDASNNFKMSEETADSNNFLKKDDKMSISEPEVSSNDTSRELAPTNSNGDDEDFQNAQTVADDATSITITNSNKTNEKPNSKYIGQYNKSISDEGKTIERDDIDVNEDEVSSRVRADLAHLALEAVPAVAASAGVVGIAKHLCGVATDYALRCVAAPGALAKARGVVVATCCHHRCQRAAYVGASQLQELGIDAEELDTMLGVVSWATCGDGRSRRRPDQHPLTPDQHPPPPDQHPPREERELVGRRAKAILDWGRVLWLRERGFEARLCYYVPREVSLENVCLVAKKR